MLEAAQCQSWTFQPRRCQDISKISINVSITHPQGSKLYVTCRRVLSNRRYKRNSYTYSDKGETTPVMSSSEVRGIFAFYLKLESRATIHYTGNVVVLLYWVDTHVYERGLDWCMWFVIQVRRPSLSIDHVRHIDNGFPLGCWHALCTGFGIVGPDKAALTGLWWGWIKNSHHSRLFETYISVPKKLVSVRPGL